MHASRATMNCLINSPYAQRQFLIVVKDSVKQAQEEAKKAIEGQKDKVEFMKILKKALVFMNFGTMIINTTLRLIKAVNDLNRQGLNILQLSQSESQFFSFPPGHPRTGILYIAHPAVKGHYFPTAHFHRLTFEHKFSEAVTLLMALGAIELEVHHNDGWSKEFAATLSVPLDIFPGTGGGGVKKKNRANNQILFKANLEDNNSFTMPENLFWYASEPTWQQIANGRLKYGMRDFHLLIQYEDDYGVNADLKAKVKKVGLELGGKFENHKSTRWIIKGRFGERPTY
ncbi:MULTISPECIES: hypothetical protein [Priestia]|uniref:hypothetical protein n=1 Tax=Priestia TaxID=2800373 RepID=UPI001128437F|nr:MULTISPECIES: hypothetical protein [Priestia]